MFEDRRDAGRRLARKLASFGGPESVVVGLPRGGVVVASEVAAALGSPLDVIVVRNLRAPEDPKLAIGALVAGAPPDVALDEDAIATLKVAPDYVLDEITAQLAEARLREALLREGRRPMRLAGRTAIVVDDGVATGNTMAAALRAVRRARPRHVVLAVPIAAVDALATLRPLVDEIVCLRVPQRFEAVGAFYREFAHVSDGEAGALLACARMPEACGVAAQAAAALPARR
jgi:putative phosphoribosyl transferase